MLNETLQSGNSQVLAPKQLFLCYTRRDRRLPTRFRELFEPLLMMGKSFAGSLWQDVEMGPGEDWQAKIDAALRECAAGVILVSPWLLANEFVKRFELPALRAKALPLALCPVDPRLTDFGLLEGLHTFRYENPLRFQGVKAFSQCRGEQRREFVDAFYAQVVSRMEQL
jgi:hypothetical protein